MSTLNEDYLDHTLEHHVYVLQFSQDQINRLIKLLDDSSKEISKIIQSELPVVLGSKKQRDLFTKVRRTELFLEFKKEFLTTMEEFATIEAAFEATALETIIPVSYSANVPKDVYSQLIDHVFQVSKNQSATVESLFDSIAASDRLRIESTIALGMQQGKGISEIVRDLRGTAAANFSDGVYATTQRQGEAIVRTVVNHVSNTARELTLEANSDIIMAERWVATLDTRTSPICRFRDGRIKAIGDKPLPPRVPRLEPPNATPPAHYN